MPDRLPPPWTVHHNEDSYWVEDATGQKIVFIYYRRQSVVGTDRGVRLSPDLARRVAVNIARLPDLLRALRLAGFRGR
ncbi:MAG: hypothetical protein ACOY71_08390 [Gemmatimonadota bacterium]